MKLTACRQVFERCRHKTAVSKPVISADLNTGKVYIDKPLIYHKGEMVVPLRKVDYDGRKLRQYDDCYTITQINGDRAVLMARGQVWAAMNIKDIEKA